MKQVPQTFALTFDGEAGGITVDTPEAAKAMLADHRAANPKLGPKRFSVTVYNWNSRVQDWVDGPAFVEA